MRSLHEGFALCRRELVCLVGAGGKTSLLRRLAREIATDSGRVLVTTSTRMLRSELESCGPLVIESNSDALLRALRVQHAQVTAAAGAIGPDGKAVGLGVSELDRIYESGIFGHILVEADGARGRDLKAPAFAEPVIPATATTVLALVGLRAVGHLIGATHVHRPEHVALIANQEVGSEISGETLLRIFERYRVLSLRMAPRAAFLPVLSQADTPERLELAMRLAARLSSSYDRVLVTAARRHQCVCEVLC